MKKTIKKLILIIMILSLIMGIVGCVNNGEKDPIPGDDGVLIPEAEPIDKDLVFSKITSGIINSGTDYIADKTYVKSTYGIMIGQINLTIFYEANYKERKQDSELMLRFYDEVFGGNRVFVYYSKGDLYYSLNENKNKVAGFGGSSMFETFYDVITYFDLRGTIYSSDVTEYFDMLKNIVSDKMIRTNVTNDKNAENISITNVNLDRAKKQINDFVSAYFGQIGTKIDIITQELFGISFSDLAHFEINRLNADLLEFVLQDKKLNSSKIEFSGIQTDNISNFSVKLAVENGNGEIKLNPNENLFDFLNKRQGESHYEGRLNIPNINDNLHIEVKSQINNTDDANNKISISIKDSKDSAENVIGLYYGDGTFYADITNFKESYLGNGIKLEKLNFPKVKFSGLNLASELNLLFNKFKDVIAQSIADGLPNFDINAPDNILALILKNTETVGNTIYVTIDQELLSALLGDNYDSIVEYIAEQLELDKETVEILFNSMNLKDAKLVIGYNVKTNVLSINLNDSEKNLIFGLELKAVDIDPDKEFIIEPPKGMDLAEHKEFASPSTILMDIKGVLTMQGQEDADFSNFLGVFLGDVTGKNSKFKLSSKDKMHFELKATQTENKTSIYAYVYKLDPLGAKTKIINISTSSDNFDVYLIDFYLYDLKYQISREGLNEAFKDLLGGDNIFSDENIFKIFDLINKDTGFTIGDNSLKISLKPYYDKDGNRVDPLYKLLGINNLIAEFDCVIDFNEDIKLESPSGYAIPKIDKIETKYFSSMYQAVWHDKVEVDFNGKKINFELSFLGDSAKLVSNKYYYEPIAKLLGEDVSYVMILTDTINGTKIIKEIAVDKIVIDPSLDNCFPEFIDVVYYDPTESNPDGISYGKLPFTIIDFPYDKNNIYHQLQGMPLTNYKIIIGEGSIAEVSFTVPIEILGRNIVANKNAEGFDDMINDVYVVDEIIIDPILFGLYKKDNSDYNPFIKNLLLRFYTNTNKGNEENPIIEIIEISNYDWNFKHSLVNYGGGEFYAFGKFNRLDIALRIIVLPKVLDSISIEGENKNNQYTIDSIISQTYHMPTYSIPNREIRINFNTGRYRIVGDGPLTGNNLPINCDGYYPISLNWQFASADNVKITETTNPLDKGSTNINKATFGNDIIGTQTIKLTVLCPSRKVDEMPMAQTCITGYVFDEQGNIVESIVQAVKYSSVAFPGLKVGEFYKFNPYETDDAKKRLPSAIDMEVKVGDTKVTKTYKISYIESTIVDSSGKILNPTNKTELLLVRAYLGDNKDAEQIVDLIVENLSGIYESVSIYDPISDEQIMPDEEKRYIIERNQFQPIQLPTSFVLKFAKESGISDQVYNAVWYYTLEDMNKVQIVDGRYFAFKTTDYLYKITSYIDKNDENGILAQEVNLYIKVRNYEVTQGTIYGIVKDEANLEYASDYQNLVFDTYLENSKDFLDRMKSGVNKIGILLTNNMKINNIAVEWQNMNDVIIMLMQNGARTVILEGKIFKGYPIEKTVTISISSKDNVIDTISYVKADKNNITNKDIEIKTQIAQKQITLTLNRPYKLTADYKEGDATIINGLATPKQYVEHILSEIQLNLVNSGIKLVKPIFNLPANFDKLAIDNSKVQTTITFDISNLTQGSSADNYKFTLITIQDKPLKSSETKIVEVFSEDGGLKYTEGYNTPKVFPINYTNSGIVVYPNIVWRSQSDYLINVNGNSETLIKVGDIVTNIDARLFDLNNGRTITLYTVLPNGSTFFFSLVFPKKNLNKTQFNATATNSNYSIKEGLIKITNIYNIYPFSTNNLPLNLIPLKTNPEYGVSPEYDVVFKLSSWTIAPAFLDEGGNFKFDMINAKGMSRTLLATARLNYYNGEYQNVEVYIEVDSLENGQLAHDRVPFANNNATIDPYINNFGGNLVLPKDLVVTFKNGVTHKFSSSSALSFTYKNFIGDYISINSIPYDYLGHSLEDYYPDGNGVNDRNNEIYLKVTLMDGLEIEFTMVFNSRKLDAVEIKSFGDKDTYSKYYIDPYDISTYQVPQSLRCLFESGAPITLTAKYVIKENANRFDGNYKLKENQNNFLGAEFEFTFKLDGYGVAIQEYKITVIILKRDLKTNSVNRGTHNFANPIEALVSDIPSDLKTSDFEPINDEIFNNLNVTLSKPNINWNINNDYLNFDGIFGRAIKGSVSFGTIKLQEVEIVINSPKWVYDSIEIGNDEKAIVFNPNTLESIKTSFYINFKEYDSNGSETEEKRILFYTKDYVLSGNNNVPVGADKLIIDWDMANNNESLKHFFIGNNYKNVKIKVSDFNFYFDNFAIKGIQFPYAKDDLTFQASGEAELVLDPLLKVVPLSVLAQGKLIHDGGLIDLGYVKIEWVTNEIYNMPIGGGFKLLECYLIVGTSEPIPYEVKVYYINRTPEKTLVDERNYSSTSDTIDGKYIIQEKGKSSTFYIDPINSLYYNEATGTYRLPANYYYIFSGNGIIPVGGQNIEVEVIKRALVGNTSKTINVSNYDLSEAISLYGTTSDKPIIVSFKKYKIDDIEFTSTIENVLHQKLNVQDREVAYTSISEGFISAEHGRTYQRAKEAYFIDPYAISLPETVVVYFKNAAQGVTYENIKWVYDENYIKSDAVINGNIRPDTNPALMSTPGEFKVFGTTLKIHFTIKGRGILTDKNENGGTIPLKGGKLYVLKGKKLSQQLPKSIYYKFRDKETQNIIEIANIPLQFIDVDAHVDINQVGLYKDIVANLGWGDKGNIIFDIEVIDPKIFNIEAVSSGSSTLIKQGSLFYDKLAIAVDNNNIYISGIEKSVYPNKIIINEKFDQLEVREIEYFPSLGYAMVNCSYVFLDSTDDQNICGSNNDMDGSGIRQNISFRVDIITYDYTKVDQAVKLDAENNTINIPLGTKLEASKMPKGYSGNIEIPLIWDFSPEDFEVVNTNKAGRYYANGYYKNTFGRTLAIQLTIVIDTIEVDYNDITIDENFLTHDFTGEKIEKVPIKFGKYLKPDGEFGNIEGYLIEYSIDGGNAWSTNQPINVRDNEESAYKLRVTIEDPNYYGSKIFDYKILKKRIYGRDIEFRQSQNGIANKVVEFEYNGLSQLPFIYGIPSLAEYYITVNGSRDINAINASENPYLIKVVFPEQRNYQIYDENNDLECKMTIKSKTIYLEVVKEIDYIGEYMHAKVRWINYSNSNDNGYLSELESLQSITYTYTKLNSNDKLIRIKDAGKYTVTIEIDGGSNYKISNAIAAVSFEVKPVKLVINIGTVTSEYLEEIKPLNSSAEYIGLVGSDKKEALGVLEVYCISGEITNIHMIGTYTLRAKKLTDVENNKTLLNYDIEWNESTGYGDGSYIITADAFYVVNNKEELNLLVKGLKDGDNARWLLKKDSNGYGDITINANASVAIVGSYEFDQNNKPIIAVSFDSITIERGAVLIDIVKINATSDKVSIYIGDQAGAVTINRTNLSNQYSTYLTNSTAIKTSLLYSNKLYLDNTKIIGYNIAIHLQKGSLDMQNCLVDNNISGVYVGKGEISLSNNIFKGNKNYALYLHDKISKIAIVNNTFESNGVGIKSYRELKADITIENKFITNAKNIIIIK